ncbi:MAG TPA: signal peptidase I [Bryobacteraceae bacterium]|nr:signal peptidase I [Bryobacteraceae bacterium]
MKLNKKAVKAPLPRHWIADWAFNILMLVWATSVMAQPFVVPTGSMESTIMTGDHIIVDKIAYSPAGPISKHLLPYQDVHRGDIVVFRYPLNINTPYVKRVIGVPGDRVRLHHNQLYLNGKLTQEPYINLDGPNDGAYWADFPSVLPAGFRFRRGAEMFRDYVKDGELHVPEGQYLCLGDNRQNSEDSRDWGLVPRENITGKPVVIWWSFDASTEHLATYSPGQVWNLATNFFSKTRWDRTLQFVRSYPLGAD